MPAAPPLSERTAAIVVVYRPQRSIEPLLEALDRSVAQTVVVDNADPPDPSLAALAARQGMPLIANRNRGVLAGAYNQALAWLRQQRPDRFDWVVLLDDDSNASVLAPMLADPRVVDRLDDAATAAVAPAYRDRATGLRGKFIELDRWRLRYLPREFTGVRRVAFVINSMSVWRLATLDRLGPFDEDLAIDHVDTEHCLRARSLGQSIWVLGDLEFAHAIGERRRFRFLGREMQAGGHPPARRYLIARNTVRLARRWAWREPAFCFLCLTRLGYEALGITLAEDRKASKLWALLRGAIVGLLGPRRR